MNYVFIMKRYIENQIRLLNAIDTDCPTFDVLQVGDGLRQSIKDIELKASTEGQPEIVEACQMRGGPISIGLARLVLARCLAIVKDELPTDWLMVSEVAELLRVSESKVLGWIHNQQLIAKNLSTSDRPQYRIHLEDIQKLDTSSPEPNKPRRRRSQQKDYFPDM